MNKKKLRDFLINYGYHRAKGLAAKEIIVPFKKSRLVRSDAELIDSELLDIPTTLQLLVDYLDVKYDPGKEKSAKLVK